MTDQKPAAQKNSVDADYPRAIRRTSRVVNLAVWVIPLLVLVICGYIVDRNVIRTGPMIQIAFQADAPVEADKTPVRYKGVEIGRVKKVELSHDLRYVLLDVRLYDFAKEFAAEGAEYWIVRPKITSSGVQGIETLTSGSYIGALPGRGTNEIDLFRGLSEDPSHLADPNALHLSLLADTIAKLQIGSSVLYRGVAVGEVETIELDKKADSVKIGIFVQGPYRDLINATTKFDYLSGFDASFDLTSGAHFSISSFATLLNGAVEFTTPDKGAPPLSNNTMLHLNIPENISNKKADTQEPTGFKLTLLAHKITKLSPGSEIQYRGITVGQVDTIALNKRSDDIRIGITIKAQFRDLLNSSTKFWYSDGVQADFGLLSGASLQLSSLPVILNGAIDFTTPDKDAPRLDPRYMQPLYDEYNKKWDAGRPSETTSDQ